jgi:hypothetical protein
VLKNLNLPTSDMHKDWVGGNLVYINRWFSGHHMLPPSMIAEIKAAILTYSCTYWVPKYILYLPEPPTHVWKKKVFSTSDLAVECFDGCFHKGAGFTFYLMSIMWHKTDLRFAPELWCKTTIIHYMCTSYNTTAEGGSQLAYVQVSHQFQLRA